MMRSSIRAAVFVVSALGVMGMASQSRAEFTLSAYGGFSASPDSDVEVFNGPTNWNASIQWDGVSFNMPPYYGVRATYWLEDFNQPNWGVALDFNHNKVKAKNRPAGVETLEFTDGINYVTLNALYKFPNSSFVTPYVGLGAGISVPHVEYQEVGGPRTFEYQFGGPVVAGMLGADFKVTDNVSLFTEYRATYSWNDTSLNGGGTLQTNLFTHHIMAGVSFTFDWN
jgi:lipid A oxidase